MLEYYWNKLMIKTVSKQFIEVQDWDKLVQETYGRPYSFQQQDGCKDRGNHRIRIPDEAYDFENESIPEEVNGEIRGVSFAAWLARDPKQPIKNQKYDWILDIFWERNFYPDVQMVANDLHKKGLIPAGDYIINIDW